MQHRLFLRTPAIMGLGLAVTACGGLLTEEEFTTQGDVSAVDAALLSIHAEVPTRIYVVEGLEKITYELSGDIITDSQAAADKVRDRLQADLAVEKDEVVLTARLGPGTLGQFLGELVVHVPDSVGLDVDQTLGSLHVEQPRDLVARVDNGDVRLVTDLREGSVTNLEVRLGNIFLEVPQDFSADLDIRANERIEINHPGLAGRQESVQPMVDFDKGLFVGYQVSVGSSQAALHAQTSGGECSRSVGAVIIDALR